MEQAKTFPAEIVFNDFRLHKTYEVKLKIFFHHSRPHKVRLVGPDQQHFSVLKLWHKNILCCHTATFWVVFKPKEQKNYVCSLTYKMGYETYDVPITGFPLVPVHDLTGDTNMIQLHGSVSGPTVHWSGTTLIAADIHICERYDDSQYLTFWSPKVKLSHDLVTVGNVVMSYQQTYQLTVSNWGLSQAPFRLVPSHSTRRQCYRICASEGTVPPGQEQHLTVTFCAETQGCFEDMLLLEVEGMLHTPCVTFKGCVMDNPSLSMPQNWTLGMYAKGASHIEPASFSLRSTLASKLGFSFGQFMAELEPFHNRTFEVTFDPAAAQLECGKVNIVMRIKVKNEAAVPVRLRAMVGMPSRTVSTNNVAVTPCP